MENYLTFKGKKWGLTTFLLNANTVLLLICKKVKSVLYCNYQTNNYKTNTVHLVFEGTSAFVVVNFYQS